MKDYDLRNIDGRNEVDSLMKEQKEIDKYVGSVFLFVLMGLLGIVILLLGIHFLRKV
jgi:hypothetical protein